MAEKIILFDGSNIDDFINLDGSKHKWAVEFGTMTVVPGSGNIVSKQTFGDAQLHVEFRLPYMPDCEGQYRANSGVYIHGCYEVQVLDSFGKKTPPANDDCSAIYSLLTPETNACLPPLEWQTYDLIIRAPRFNENGSIKENARLTALHNGIVVHNNVELPRATPGGTSGVPVAEGPVMLQDHGNTVAYRNIWIMKL
ncbi:MAG: DUF1080 domain-containing protein [Clostridiales bacterium]|jgi:hypothetical protein|nr:DUF1080 domain-containing protein [Clostridiales bacterium]